VVLCLLGLVTAGCGYRFATGLPDGVRQVRLALRDDTVARPGLHAAVVASLRRALLHRGATRVGEEAGEAAALVEGTITEYANEAMAFDRTDVGRRFRVRVTVQLRVQGPGGSVPRLLEPIWGEAFYSSGRGIAATKAAEDEAAVRAVRDLADRAAARIAQELM
jgi:hypothetical protein